MKNGYGDLDDANSPVIHDAAMRIRHNTRRLKELQHTAYDAGDGSKAATSVQVVYLQQGLRIRQEERFSWVRCTRIQERSRAIRSPFQSGSAVTFPTTSRSKQLTIKHDATGNWSAGFIGM